MDFYQDCPDLIRPFIQILDLEADYMLLRQGDDADFIYYLIDGELQCYAVTEKGLKHIVYVYRPGEIVGEIEVFSNEPILTSVIVSKPSRLYRIDRHNFGKWFESSPDFARFITTQISRKLSNTFAVTSLNLSYSIKKQFMQQLLQIQKEYNGAFYVDKKEIAGILGCHYRSINRIVQDLTESELIHYHKGTFEIPDLVRFQEALRKQD